MSEDIEELNWLRAFEAKNGRKLRVLHIGNIANNAYLVAKFLRAAGVEADVLAYDYYHVMGTPEWEELSITHDYGDDYQPRFSSEDVGSYSRPQWFVSGPVNLCASYLAAVHVGDEERLNRLRALLMRSQAGDRLTARELRVNAQALSRESWSVRRSQLLRQVVGFFVILPYRIARLLGRWGTQILRAIKLDATANAFVRSSAELKIVRKFVSNLTLAKVRIEHPTECAYFQSLIEEFAKLFPNRFDQLSFSDFTRYLSFIPPLQKLFSEYDIVQAYATDPILPLICGKTPFVAFEHGTLRDFIRENIALHRLTALAYRKANHVFITNGDCQEHARWLGCKNATAMLHPIDVEQHRKRDEVAIRKLRNHYNAETLLFCPIRHDWAVKGTDVHIRSLPQIRECIHGRIILVLAPWGLQVEDSRRLIKNLGCEDMVVWLDRPLCRIELIKHMQAADVVLDQMTLPHFGATAPQSLAAGTPIVMSYKPESTAWIVDEPAPILAAFNPHEVAEAVVTALDPTWRRDFVDRARIWVDLHHHNNRVVQDHLKVYRHIMETSDVSS